MKVIGHGSPVLCLHSSLSSHKQWLPLSGCLSEDYQVWLPDLLGYGSSQQVESQASIQHSLADEAAALLRQLPQEVQQQPIILIGHSFGGAVALHLARTARLKLKAVILFEPVAFHILAASTSPEAISLTAEVVALAEQMLTLGAEDAARLFVDYWQQQDYFKQLPLRMQLQMARQVWKVPHDFHALITESASLLDYQQIAAPILLLRGKQSRDSALMITTLFAEIWPRACVETLDTGHMGPVTAANAVNARIERFIRALEA
jgi:pimeloyl-ACP methyl ester carboxylesterase